MKKVTILSSVTLDGLNEHADASDVFSALATQLGEIQESQSGGKLEVSIVVKGHVFSNYPGAIVAAHEAIDEAFAAAGNLVKTDLSIGSVREPKPAIATEPRAAKVEKAAP